MTVNPIYVDNLIKEALLEDINYLDTTTDYLIPPQQISTANFLAKADGVLCGIEIAMRVFWLLQPDFKYEIFIQDGEKVKKGDIIATITCNTRTLLKCERTALNLVQHLSGIATETARCVELVKGTKASIADKKDSAGTSPYTKVRCNCRWRKKPPLQPFGRSYAEGQPH